MVLVGGVVTDVFFHLLKASAPAGFFVRFHTRSRPSTRSKKLISPTSHRATSRGYLVRCFPRPRLARSLTFPPFSSFATRSWRRTKDRKSLRGGKKRKKVRGWKGGFFAFKMKLRNGGTV